MSQQVRVYRKLDIKKDGITYINGTAVVATATELNLCNGLTVTTAELNKVAGVDPQVIYFTTQLADVSASSNTYLMTPPCTITKVWVVLDAAVTTANATITLKNNAGASMGTIVLDNTAAGAGGDLTATAANAVFTEGQRLLIGSDGGSTTESVGHFTIKATRSS